MIARTEFRPSAATKSVLLTNNYQIIAAFQFGEQGKNLTRGRIEQIHAMQFQKTKLISMMLSSAGVSSRR
jgi:hypothetical protein